MESTWCLGAALFFGFAQSLGITGGTIPVLKEIPSVFLTILPYVFTILALVGFVGRSEALKALGTPYEKENDKYKSSHISAGFLHRLYLIRNFTMFLTYYSFRKGLM